jgi:hypothetical protein
MRTKLIAFAVAASGVLLAGAASAEGLHHCKKPLIQRAAVVTLAKQPTLVQSVPAPRKPL